MCEGKIILMLADMFESANFIKAVSSPTNILRKRRRYLILEK